MNFAGKFAYVSRADEDNDEELNVAEDELQHSSLAEAGLVDGVAAPRERMDAAPRSSAAAGPGIFASFAAMFRPASAGGAPPPPPAPVQAAPAAAASSVHKEEESKKEKKRVYRRQADTNVVALQFSTLANKADENVFAGDPVYCGNERCRAALSFTSKPFNRKKKPSASNPDEKSPEPFASVTIVPKAASSDDAPLMAPAPDTLALSTIPEAATIPTDSISSISSVNSEPFHVQIDNVDADEEETVWCCEYCGHENIVVLTPEEVPTTETRDYILEPASDSKSAANAEAGNVIFVVDVSGSMCVTTEVPGRFQLKGAAARAAAAFDIPAEAGFVNAPVHRSSATTHVTRLQCVQAAIDQQIEDWKKSQPQRQVGLVTFNREVSVFGDGTNPPEIITGDKLSNQALLQEIGSKLTLSKPISQSAESLTKHLWDLEEGGPTALGPALLVAVSMASKSIGSRVVVCTDGLANVGLGALDKNSCPTDEARQRAEQWYESVGHLAKLSGVLVSVISIKGEECALEDLGKVAEITGGDVNRVDPQELQKNFNNLLAKPVIATQVTATILMHQGLVFRNEDQATNRLVREVGNVNEDTEITFEYGLRSDDVLKEFEQLKSLPFQVQITFTKLDGMKCLRVLSKAQPITRDRQQAEQEVQMDVLAANVQQQTAKLAEKGDLLNARVNNLAWGKYLHKHSSRNTANSNVYNQWVQEADSHHSSLSVQQAAVSSMGPSPAGSAARSAKAVRGDAGYQEQHRAKTKSSAAYRKIS